MRNNLGKAISFVLAFAITLSSFLTLSAISGVSKASAAVDTNNSQNELWLMTDYTKALVKNERKPISEAHPDAAPYAFMGNSMTYYVPLSAVILYTGGSYSVSGDVVTVTLSGGAKKTMTVGSLTWSGGTFLLPPVLKDGEVYLSSMSVQAVFSLKSFFNEDIGLIVLSTKSIGYDRSYKSLKMQIQNLRFLLFDTITGDGIVNDMKKTVGMNTHPRLLVYQDRFDELADVYRTYEERGYAEGLEAEMTVRRLNQALSYFNGLFEETEDGAGHPIYQWKSQEALESVRQPYYLYDENGNRLIGKTSYVNKEGETITLESVYGKTGLYGDGYDEGGRSNVAAQSQKLYYFAYAWQLTGDEKYVYAFYQLAKQLGNWVHWGEGHFLNCADGASYFALGLDWIWHAFDDEPAKRDELCKILYDKAVNVAYYCIANPTEGKNKGILHRSKIAGENWGLTGYTNNWNTVCCSGITLAALTLLENSAYTSECRYVMEKQMNSLYKCLIQYAPDGSYIESPGYWSYGTNTYMLMLSAMKSSLGTTYGLQDTVGLRDSYYFMNNIADGDFTIWNYHDGGRGRIDGPTFYMAATLYQDPTIAFFRDNFLARYVGNCSLYDVLFYDEKLSEGAETNTPLDSYFKGIETATMRSSREKTATFAGLHVGANSVSHGDVDCGNFYLEMGGVLWFGDEGAEDYNIGGYWTTNPRYYFYRKSLEAHNTIVIHPQPGDTSSDIYKYGQTFNSQTGTYAKIDTFGSDENGAYAISNMKPQYGATCSSATRGMLMTNSRSTVVVQDDIEFNKPTSLTWLAGLYMGSVSFSADKRTAYLKSSVTNGNTSNTVVLRASIVSDDPDLKFDVTNSTILPNTITNLTNNNNKYPKASSARTRLCIEAKDVTSFHCAVVFELYKPGGLSEAVVGYEYTDPSDWVTVTDEWVKEANKDIIYPSDLTFKYSTASIMRAINRINAEPDLGKRLAIIKETSILMTDLSPYDQQVQSALKEYMVYVDQYNKYVRKQNLLMEESFPTVIGMFAKPKTTSAERKEK